MINGVQEILAPIDGPKQAQRTLRTALEIAKVHKSDLEILHVTSHSEEYVPSKSKSALGPTSEGPLSPSEWIRDYMAKVKEDTEKMLSQALKDAVTTYPGLKITAKLLLGRPGKTIVNEAEEGEFDLIVIGCRGLSGLAELVLGSVSNEVVNGSNIPVLVVK